MTKKVVISGYYGAGNFGDELILETLIQRLKKHDAEITVLSLNPEETSKLHNVSSVKSFDFSEVLKSIVNCDLLISGGGSLLQDVTSLKSLFYYLIVIFTAQFFGKNSIVFAQGIGPIKNKLGLILTKLALKNCSSITVRDEKSLFLLRSWGLNNAILVCDPLFELKLNSPNTQNKVGVQLRSFKTMNETLLITLANRIALDFSDKEIEIYSFQDENDLEVCEHFKSLLSSINSDMKVTVISGKTPQELVNLMANLEYIIAMRFHAVLIAIRYGIKTLAINYDYKVENLANEVNLPAISMKATEDYGYMFTRLKNLTRSSLLDFANSKKFNWLPLDLSVK